MRHYSLFMCTKHFRTSDLCILIIILYMHHFVPFVFVTLTHITLPYDVQQLSKATKETATLYLACGVDTSKAFVFVQSHVRAHVELMWLLRDENVGVGLLTYPVLMASDILLYQS
uniref:Tryptophan--tRNA ligase n=1 Tax=Lactuca sativa TaxID=4236 RepID=A0A9R1XWU6_LACSA|nr:hypothetical protein LSAT_V11C100026740 [Lactuca sativa]